MFLFHNTWPMALQNHLAHLLSTQQLNEVKLLLKLPIIVASIHYGDPGSIHGKVFHVSSEKLKKLWNLRSDYEY